MNTNLLLICLLGHVIGDYYFQTPSLSIKKNQEYKYVIIHSLLYAVATYIVLLPIWSTDIVLCGLYISVSHFAIDSLKYALYQYTITQPVGKLENKLNEFFEKGYAYAIDQVLHFMIILTVISVFSKTSIVITGNFEGVIGILKETLYLTGEEMLKSLLCVLLILKPVNITFKSFFKGIKPGKNVTHIKRDISVSPLVFMGPIVSFGPLSRSYSELNSSKETVVNNKDASVQKKEIEVGKLIGNLERLLVLSFMVIGQYSAIGIIFAGKSITRYKKISDDPEFAEYYLLGTFFSILSTIVVYHGIQMIH